MIPTLASNVERGKPGLAQARCHSHHSRAESISARLDERLECLFLDRTWMWRQLGRFEKFDRFGNVHWRRLQ
jgi:hypothetical protein